MGEREQLDGAVSDRTVRAPVSEPYLDIGEVIVLPCQPRLDVLSVVSKHHQQATRSERFSIPHNRPRHRMLSGPGSPSPPIWASLGQVEMRDVK